MTKAYKAGELAPVNWPAIEPHYRAGIRSIKAISAEFGVSRPAIDKHARKHGWVRDLAPAIREKSDRQVAQVAVAPPSCSPARSFSDQAIVDAGAEQLTLVRLGHRQDIAELRGIAKALVAELRDMTAQVDSIPARERVLRGLADTTQRLVAMERESFGLNTLPDGGDRPMVHIKDFTGRGDPDSPFKGGSTTP